MEGATHPFSMYTDHKNLEYLINAKCLIPRQARWALFFKHLSFSITYRPGHKNIRSDALSRLHALAESPPTPETILPQKIFACPIQLSNTLEISSANAPSVTPPGCPPDCLYIPTSQCTTIIQSVHSSYGIDHQGASVTLSLLRNRFLWLRNVLSPGTHATYQQASSNHCPFHIDPGHTWECILSEIYHRLLVRLAY